MSSTFCLFYKFCKVIYINYLKNINKIECLLFYSICKKFLNIFIKFKYLELNNLMSKA